jgi:hypothetical protein
MESSWSIFSYGKVRPARHRLYVTPGSLVPEIQDHVGDNDYTNQSLPQNNLYRLSAHPHAVDHHKI